MTSGDGTLSYASFCGSLLDDMLGQIIHTIITRSLLDEKLIRKDYGTVKEPIFHDPPFFKDSQSNSTSQSSQSQPKNKEASQNVISIDDESDDENSDYDNDKKKNKNTNNNNNNNNNKLIRYEEPDIGRFSFTLNGKDIYVNALNDNRNLLGAKANSIVIGTAQDTYFKCSNCERKIAGSRFGAHIDKCLGGRSRK